MVKKFVVAMLLVALAAVPFVSVMAVSGRASAGEAPAGQSAEASEARSPLFDESLDRTNRELDGEESVDGGGIKPVKDGANATPRRGNTYDITAYWTCMVSCMVTCAYQTCSGPACGETMDTTCSGATCSSTCSATCSGATCETTCTDCPPPKPPRTTSRTWGHDSIGTDWISSDWYLPEGSTANGFETWILVQNPQNQETEVRLTYMTPAGAKGGPKATLPPYSRASFNVAATVPNEPDVSTKVSTGDDSKWVVAERAMYGPGRRWGHNSIGSYAPARMWYLAEGCTAGGFETWILVQNPNNKATNVLLSYMTPQGRVQGPRYKLPANSRKSFLVADTVPDAWEISTSVIADADVVAERAVYWGNRTGGHESVGVSYSSNEWYLAEGSTAGGFETFVLVQNPGDKAASVDVEFMTENGARSGPHLNLAPYSRRTVNVADFVPDTWSVSSRVTSSSSPVIAERSVYWNNRNEGHDSIGTTADEIYYAEEGAQNVLGANWALAEGSTNWGFETWILVQNPNDQDLDVSIFYMTPNGTVTGPSETIGANSRKSFNVADTLPGEAEVSAIVSTADQSLPVIAERSMYGDPN